MTKEEKKEINKILSPTIIKRKLQLHMFILLGLLSVSIIVLVCMGIFTSPSLLALIPFILMMKHNIDMWELYNSTCILQKVLHDKEFYEEFCKENGI
jgi:hypothetical protein